MLIPQSALEAASPHTLTRSARSMAAVASDQCAPASRVICTLPSSAPTQITPACAGDSEIVVMVQNWMEPPGGVILLASLVVRSGEMRSQVSP